jgi:serine/threonine protein kinase
VCDGGGGGGGGGGTRVTVFDMQSHAQCFFYFV